LKSCGLFYELVFNIFERTVTRVYRGIASIFYVSDITVVQNGAYWEIGLDCHTLNSDYIAFGEHRAFMYDILNIWHRFVL